MQILVYFFILENEIHEIYISGEKKNYENNINHFDIAGFFSLKHSMTFSHESRSIILSVLGPKEFM